MAKKSTSTFTVNEAIAAHRAALRAFAPATLAWDKEERRYFAEGKVETPDYRAAEMVMQIGAEGVAAAEKVLLSVVTRNEADLSRKLQYIEKATDWHAWDSDQFSIFMLSLFQSLGEKRARALVAREWGADPAISK